MLYLQPEQVGHVFNVINQDGKIIFIDGQTRQGINLRGLKKIYILDFRYNMSINRFMATEIASEKIQVLKKDLGLDLKIIDEEIIEKDFYFVFFYNSKLYIESGDFSYAMAGNSPFIIDKIQGNVYETGSANNIEFYMKEFEKKNLPLLIV